MCKVLTSDLVGNVTEIVIRKQFRFRYHEFIILKGAGKNEKI